MSAWTQDDVNRHNAKLGAKMPAHVAKKSKYKNVRTSVEGENFDSKREALYWVELKLREKAGEITELERQVSFELRCPIEGSGGMTQTVCSYIADFTYHDNIDHQNHIVDIKGGKETAMFALKRKWLFLQSGIEIEVVR